MYYDIKRDIRQLICSVAIKSSLTRERGEVQLGLGKKKKRFGRQIRMLQKEVISELGIAWTKCENKLPWLLFIPSLLLMVSNANCCKTHTLKGLPHDVYFLLCHSQVGSPWDLCSRHSFTSQWQLHLSLSGASLCVTGFSTSNHISLWQKYNITWVTGWEHIDLFKFTPSFLGLNLGVFFHSAAESWADVFGCHYTEDERRNPDINEHSVLCPGALRQHGDI